MINQGYTEGIRVTSSYPFPFSKNVDVDTSITLQLNVSPDSQTIMDAVAVIDGGDIPDDKLGELSIELFKKQPRVESTFTFNHDKREIVISPREYLEIDKKYIIIVEGLKDIYGNEQVDNYILVFYTSSLDTVKPIELLYPPNNTILKSLNEFQWIKRDTNGYVFEISKDSSFSVVEFNQNIIDRELKTLDNVVNYNPAITLEDGTYFWRVKAVDGNWSETNTFRVQRKEKSPISLEDYERTDASEEDLPLLDDIIEVVNDNFSDAYVELNSQVVHIEFSGYLTIDDFLEVLMYSEEESVLFDKCSVYDEEEDITHMFLILKDIEKEGDE